MGQVPFDHLMQAQFRAVEEFRPTFLVDEVDTFLKANDEIQGLLNAGHELDTAYVIRCEGEENKPRIFKVWCPKLISGIGRRRDTLEDRSITINLRRKTRSEKTERLLAGTTEPFDTLKRKLKRWSSDNAEILETADPEIPQQLNDRAADNWRSLFAIADQAGSDWPLLSRRASLVLSGKDSEEENIGVMLLEDCQEYFGQEKAEKIESANLVNFLVTLEGRPWPEWRHGHPITPNGVARLLKGFGIRPRQFKIAGTKTRGYLREDFIDAWSRYLTGTPGTELKK